MTLTASFCVKGLRGWVSVLEIIFVGQCEMFVYLDFVWIPPPPPPHRAAKLIGPRTGCQFFENCQFVPTEYLPLE